MSPLDAAVRSVLRAYQGLGVRQFSSPALLGSPAVKRALADLVLASLERVAPEFGVQYDRGQYRFPGEA